MLIIKDRIVLDDRKDVVMIHLYIKSLQKKVDISDGVRGVLYYFYDIGGIETDKDFEDLVKLCIKNTSIKTKKSVRNTLSRCVGMGIIKNEGKYKKVLSTEWLPKDTDDSIGLEYKIMNHAVQEGNSI